LSARSEDDLGDGDVSAGELTVVHLGDGDVSAGELTVVHQVPDLAPERRANLAQLGKLDAAHAGLDPVVGEAVRSR